MLQLEFQLFSRLFGSFGPLRLNAWRWSLFLQVALKIEPSQSFKKSQAQVYKIPPRPFPLLVQVYVPDDLCDIIFSYVHLCLHCSVNWRYFRRIIKLWSYKTCVLLRNPVFACKYSFFSCVEVILKSFFLRTLFCDHCHPLDGPGSKTYLCLCKVRLRSGARHLKTRSKRVQRPHSPHFDWSWSIENTMTWEVRLETQGDQSPCFNRTGLHLDCQAVSPPWLGTENKPR